jgi:signal transduction histidine kinase
MSAPWLEDLKRLSDLLPEAMLLVRLDGTIEAANRSAADLLKSAPSHLTGKTLAELSTEPAEEIAARLASYARSDSLLSSELELCAGAVKVPCRVQAALLRPGTAETPALILLRLVRKDEANRFVELTRRLDELGQEVSRRRQAEDTLVEADQRKDEFLAMLAHELRNPLAPLRSGVELIEAAAGKGGQLAAGMVTPVVGILKRQVGQLTRLVDDLLDVARITHGRLHISRQPVPLLKVLEQAIETVGPSILDNQQRFMKTLPPPSVVVDADLARLSQVFVNLLSNASKFTRAGGSITLSTEVKDGHVEVRVRDDGAGLRPDLLPRLFEPFVQADKSLARPLPGLGIGLAVAHSLVTQHEGELEVFSAGVGLGTEFVVRLPARIVEVAGNDARASVAQPQSAPSSRKKILIVEDNVDAARSLEMLLTVANHEVRTAHDSEQALAALEGFDPDVILLDIGLPGMDGFQLARAIRARPQTAGVVLAALTGYGKEQDRILSAQAGFDVHFTKPVEYETLDWLLNPGTRPLH